MCIRKDEEEDRRKAVFYTVQLYILSLVCNPILRGPGIPYNVACRLKVSIIERLRPSSLNLIRRVNQYIQTVCLVEMALLTTMSRPKPPILARLLLYVKSLRPEIYKYKYISTTHSHLFITVTCNMSDREMSKVGASTMVAEEEETIKPRNVSGAKRRKRGSTIQFLMGQTW